MNNAQIAEILLGMALAVEFLEDNPFKVKAYRKAAQSISALEVSVEELIDTGEIDRVKGVGQTIGAHLKAWVKDHDFSALEQLRAQIPPGLAEMGKVQGLGIKKLRTLHRELGIATLDDLLAALDQGRLSGVKGFPDKSIGKFRGSIETVLQYRGWYLLDAAWAWGREMISLLKESGLKAEVTGACRRAMEVVQSVDLLVEGTGDEEEKVRQCLTGLPGVKVGREGDALVGTHPDKPPVKVLTVPAPAFLPALFITTGSDVHVGRARKIGADRAVRIGLDGVTKDSRDVPVRDEAEIYALLGMPYLPPEVREGRDLEFGRTMGDILAGLISLEDLVGTLHIHTTFSDGKSSLEDMARAAQRRGYAWIGISDHSRSAYYAGGLTEPDLMKQLEEIDRLNAVPGGITLLKGIESDILADGALDYPPEILSRLDFVIASVHSHMDMDAASMTERIIRAIRNPRTSILGHVTGRVLLSRQPYELDLEKVLLAAARCGVAVELNANPQRLDIDWRLIEGFVSLGGRVVIGPDAHVAGGLDDVVYGVALARKGLLAKDACLNTLQAERLKEVFASRWK